MLITLGSDFFSHDHGFKPLTLYIEKLLQNQSCKDQHNNILFLDFFTYFIIFQNHLILHLGIMNVVLETWSIESV